MLIDLLIFRRCENNHPCKKKCYEDCGVCNVSMLKKLQCGHQTSQPCHVNAEHIKCEIEVCPIILQLLFYFIQTGRTQLPSLTTIILTMISRKDITQNLLTVTTQIINVINTIKII